LIITDKDKKKIKKRTYKGLKEGGREEGNNRKGKRTRVCKID
jgi:hypothetical protein